MYSYCLTVFYLVCFQRVVELQAAAEHHDFIYVDEVGFNLCKTRRRGRNFIGHCAIVNVPGQYTVVETTQCVQPLVTIVSFIIIPLLVLTILPHYTAL